MTSTDDDLLRAIFQSVLERPATRDVSTVRQISEKNWDSLAHATLVAAIESEFGVTIDTSDALGMTSFEATKVLLSERLP